VEAAFTVLLIVAAFAITSIIFRIAKQIEGDQGCM
jgi:hypothetical protein